MEAKKDPTTILAPLIFVDIDKSGNITYVSSSVEELLGFNPATLQATSFLKFISQILANQAKDKLIDQVQNVLNGQIDVCSFVEEILPAGSDRGKRFSFHLERENPDSERVVAIMTDRTAARAVREKLAEVTMLSRRLMEIGRLIIIRTDRSFSISDIRGDTLRVLGIPADKMLQDSEVWNRFLANDDFRKLSRTIQKMADAPIEFEQEVEIIHQVTSEPRWLLLTAVPVFSNEKECIGWEGFGVDITEKRRAEMRLINQNRRTQALYEITRNLHVNTDPAYVALHGLKALLSATHSDSGFCALMDRKSNIMELVATQGCSERYVNEIKRILNKGNLLRRVIADKQGFYTDNLQVLPEARHGIAIKEGLRSAIFMPLLYKDPDSGLVIVGALQLCCKRASRYKKEDFDLVQTAAHQMSLVIRQAEYYEAEKNEADALAVLYKLNHDLLKTYTPEDTAERVFPIVSTQIACRRMWLGVLNEQSTHLVGCGGIGPGMRDQINRLQLELNLPHDFLDEAIKTQKPVLIKAGTNMECSGLNAVMRRMDVGTLLVLPLVAMGNVVGILLLEPQLASKRFINRKLPLLVRMTNEIATVILTRRLEERIVNADKMRMAGLLASGVAHNFNNLLQAIMGQASLIEMQLEKDSPLHSAAGTITQAASRGADLIRQMLSVSQHGNIKRESISIGELLEDSREMYISLLGTAIDFKLTVKNKDARFLGDKSSIQQVLTNLLVNSRDALTDRKQPRVRVEAETVRISSSEVDPQLSPGKYIRINISDNGVGMDQESQARCFEPFYTTKNIDKKTGIAFDGAGFGLSVSYSILRQHNGLLTIRSEKNQGTFLSLFLPISENLGQSDPVDRQQTAEAAQYAKKGRNQALIIDIDDSIHFTAKSVLESLGYGTTLIADRDSALKYAVSNLEQIDLLLIDLDRAGNRIISSLRDLKIRRKEIHIVAASADAARWRRVLSSLAIVINNPISVWELNNTIQNFVHRQGGIRIESIAEHSNGNVDQSDFELNLEVESEVQGS